MRVFFIYDMFKILVLVCLQFTIPAVLSQRSPHADLVEELIKSPTASRYSNNIILDALLDVPSLVTRYRYPVETHTVFTPDGYILRMHRIPRGRDQNNQPGPRKVIFLMHGLTSSSADFLVLGPGNAIGYLLAEAGYDVWLGNARGNYYSRRHLTMNPDRNIDYWRFSWDEIGYYDLATMVDYVLENTGQEKLHYVGHSQGGTAFLVLTSLRPEYNDKFASFQGWAPASFFVYNEHPMFNFLAPFEKLLMAASYALGIGEMAPNTPITTALVMGGCSDISFFQQICLSLPIVGLAIQQFNTSMLPLFIGHSPAGSSLQQLSHYGQCINSNEFHRYDFGIIGNIKKYGRTQPPKYDLSQITVPAYLHYSAGDIIVHPRDMQILSESLNNTIGLLQVSRPSFLHVDFVWAPDVRETFYEPFIELLNSLD